MSSVPPDTDSAYLTNLSRLATFKRMGDCELLEQFADRHGKNDESAELAFATLVARHGPMVLRVCRSALGHIDETEDAFQATFLVLATRAQSIRRGRSVGSWLHGVALRVAACARKRAARRQRHERRHAAMTTRNTQADRQSPAGDDEPGRILNEEIHRLPERFRSAVVLCYLEGLTHEMAADQLGCPVGTIHSRLATARDRLRRRLTRRGLAPADGPLAVSEPCLMVPAALADATVRGALHVSLGKTALAGIVSAEAVALMNGVAKALGAARLLWATTALLAGIAIAGLGISTYSTQGRNDRPAAGQADDKKHIDSQESPDAVKALLRDSRSAAQTFWITEQQAKTLDERRSLILEHQKELDSYAQALFRLAETNRGTPLAEEALIGILTRPQSSTNAERAIEIITRDHITSETIEPLFHRSGLFVTEAVENFFREALAKNPHRQIQGLACYCLARYLDIQTDFFTMCQQRNVPQKATTEQVSTRNEGRNQDAQARLRKLGPDALEREAVALYERVVKEFGDLPSGERLPNLTEAELGQARPATLGEVAQIYLYDHRILGVGKPAPEIEGVDLDNGFFKLSDYRGKVIVLYFGGPMPPSADATNSAATVTQAVQEVAQRHANDPFALLGVSTFNPGPSGGRETYQGSLKARAMPARFWWDLEQFNQPGPIQTAWNARGRIDVYVLDHRGVIRYKHFFGPEALQKAVTKLLKERKDELTRSREHK